MERKLLRIIMNPSSALVVLMGAALTVVAWEAVGTAPWYYVKLVGVALLLGYHHYCARLVRAFANDAPTHSERFFRLFNEIPALLLIVIVILAVVKPF